MASFVPSDADRLRIAIALTALKFKPVDQSCASYVLELRSAFPPSLPEAPTADGSWKSHALALEKDLASLKEKYEAERIKTLAVSSEAVLESNPIADNQPASSTMKKKTKKKSTEKRSDIPGRTALETVLEDINGRRFFFASFWQSSDCLPGREFASLPGSDSLFSSVAAFQQLTSVLSSLPTAITASQRSLLLSTTTRALMALATVLHPILHCTDVTTASKTSTLQTLAVLVHHLLTTSVPYLSRKVRKHVHHRATTSSNMNQLVEVLITHIIYPVLQAFAPLSRSYLAALFPSTSTASALPVDLRPDVLHLFQSAFSPLVAADSSYEVNLRGSLALFTLRELENLFPPRLTDGKRTLWTRDNRVTALARKDSLWYLCTVLHVLFASPKDCSTPGSALSDRPISETRILDAISRIIARCRRPPDVEIDGAGRNDGISAHHPDVEDEENSSEEPPIEIDLQVIDRVGYEMILGVMERYWRWIGDDHQDPALFDSLAEPMQ
ncbi:hypothetical protein B0H10DRAFT_927224 [Mycena sp. CBHHK59/15]|nr:hypothetical protein B0H10DRAFT_927224 [Mycena sp. CBHHK59/15]